MTDEQKIIDYILRGYSNRYINLLLGVKVDEIEHIRERIIKMYGSNVVC